MRLTSVQLRRRKKKPTTKHPTMRKEPQPAFFKLTQQAQLPLVESGAPHTLTACRLQLEGTDGSRLTLTLERLDPATFNPLSRDFLRSWSQMIHLIPQLNILLGAQIHVSVGTCLTLGSPAGFACNWKTSMLPHTPM